MDEILLTVCLADERATQQTRTKSEQNHALNQQAGNLFFVKKTTVVQFFLSSHDFTVLCGILRVMSVKTIL